MEDYELTLPNDFSDYEHELRDKGWYSLAVLSVGGKSYQVNFFDPTRLVQEMQYELGKNGFFFEQNLIVVPEINRIAMEKAVQTLVKNAECSNLVPL